MPSVLAAGPEALIWVSAPCKCTTPDRSRYQAGPREPKPASGDQLALFTLTGTSAGSTPAGARPGVAARARAEPAATMVQAMARLTSHTMPRPGR